MHLIWFDIVTNNFNNKNDFELHTLYPIGLFKLHFIVVITIMHTVGCLYCLFLNSYSVDSIYIVVCCCFQKPKKEAKKY